MRRGSGGVVVRAAQAGLRTVRSRRGAPAYAHGFVIAAFAEAYPEAFFVQVGAHDSTQLDPLREHILRRRWTGLLVEPVPEVFDRLRRNYEGVAGLRFENAAIADRDGHVALHFLPQSDDEALPPWYDALASLRRDVVLKHKPFIPDVEERLRTMHVPCLTFETLCRKHGVTGIDFLQIDTEGSDYEILELVDLDRYQPRLVMFEELHLDASTREAAIGYVGRHGYEVLENGMDVLCLCTRGLTPRDRRLQRAWRRGARERARGS